MNQLKVIFFALGLLDVIMDKCGTPFHKQVGTPGFMQQLIAMMNNKEMPKEVRKHSYYEIEKNNLIRQISSGYMYVDLKPNCIPDLKMGDEIRQVF